MDSRAKHLIQVGDGLFSAKEPWDQLNQEIAEHFYPMRADFTTPLSPGSDFQSDLMDSYPVQAREQLANMPHAILRQGNWFSVRTGDDEVDGDPGNMDWFDKARQRLRKMMYVPSANLVRASIEVDHDWVTFGTGVLSVEVSPDQDGLLYRAWHPRDCAWMDSPTGQIDHVQRKMDMTARNVVRRWKETVSPETRRIAEKEPNKAIKVRHIIMAVDEIYGSDKGMMRKMKGMPWVSLYVECETETLLSSGPLPIFSYIAPRWRKLAGVMQGFSPATINSLPDNRMLQTLARIILEQGEKAIDPPTIAKGEIFRDAVNLYAGGMTYVDLEADERIQDVFQTLNNPGQLSFGMEMKQDIRTLIAESFLLNKLMLPSAREMTAFETQARLDEYRRAALPFFGPIESDYHLPLLEATFQMAIHYRQIPEPPQVLKEREITFLFDSPLNTLEGRQTIAAYQESMQIIGATAQLDPEIAKRYDLKQMTKDAVKGAGAKPKWFLAEEEEQAMDEQSQQAAGLAGAASALQQGAGVAGDVANATLAMQQAGLV